MALHFVHAIQSLQISVVCMLVCVSAGVVALLIGCRGVFRCADALYRQSEHQERAENYVKGEWQRLQRRREYLVVNELLVERQRRESLDAELQELRATLTGLGNDPNAKPVDDDTDDDSDEE